MTAYITESTRRFENHTVRRTTIDKLFIFGSTSLRLGSTSTTRPGPVQSETRVRFEGLAKTWRAETGSGSSMSTRVLHPAYQQIIGLGQEVVPILLEELRQRPTHWFHALQSITGEDPITTSHRGSIREMADDWIRWGIHNGRLPA